ncbi:MAG TPA: pseudouridine synthase [Planctomycetota bacterium]
MPRSGKKTLDRVLSRAGLCSRSQAREAIASGRVRVNGRVVRNPELWIDPVHDKVACDGESLRARRKEVWMLHKPAGYVTTANDERNRPTVYALMPEDATWLGPVGRLDQDTSGLLLFTNDSDLANALTDPSSKLSKVYEVLCEGPIADAAITELAAGVQLDDGPTRRALVQRLGGDDDSTLLRLVITEGRNRQIRRMVAAIGSRVLALHRTQIGPLPLASLSEGEVRRLTAKELQALRAAVAARSGRDRGGERQ